MAACSPTTRCAQPLVRKGDNPQLEWVRCTLADVQTALAELKTGQRVAGSHHQTFGLRAEQQEAVDKTHAYFQSLWAEDANAAPRFCGTPSFSQLSPPTHLVEAGRAARAGADRLNPP